MAIDQTTSAPSDFTRINSSSVNQLGTELINEAKTLMKMVETARSWVEDSKSIYDSESATKFRRKMDGYAQNATEGIDTNFTNLATYFKKVASIYNEHDANIQQLEAKYLDEELFG